MTRERDARTVTLSEVLVDVWRQALVEGLSEVELGGRQYRVARTRSQGLRMVFFTYQENSIEGIEQNPEKTSRWAKLAQQGQRIMQFRCQGSYVANVCEGKLTRYPAWTSQGLPE